MQASVRQFKSAGEIERLGEGLLDRSLPHADWTHEAHFAATLYLLMARPEIELDTQLKTIISAYNQANGVENTDSSGYHETLTRFYLKIIRRFISEQADGRSLLEICNALIASELAERDYPLRFYSRERLFSVQARREFLAPDLKPF